jgi:O-acetylhomoserine/O-acetylserine sulfhydrylase-like pyridoxal-dependent enzyme
METMELTAGVAEYVRRGEEMAQAEAETRATMRGKKFDTIAVHGIYSMEAALANNGSIIEPGYLSTAQHFESSDHMEAALGYLMPAWAYTRIANPTIHYLEETLALLEGYGFAGDVSACVTGSGMAAIFMATNPLLTEAPGQSKPNLVASARSYGGTYMLFQERYANERRIEVRWVRDPLDQEEWACLIDANTRFLYGEMPANPTLDCFDIPAVANLAHAQGVPLVVDATVSTPALMRPIQHGADIVVHSVSKSMSTGGLAIAGAIIARHDLPSQSGPDELRADYAKYVKLLPLRDHGPALSPFSALMILNELRTIRHRMDRLSDHALTIARFLDQHPGVERVYYPGLEQFPGHEQAAALMWLADGEDDYGEPVNRYGHLMSFTVAGGVQATRDVFDRFRMIWRATDLGRIKSVAAIPAISTHQQQGESGRDLAALPANLIRLSIGAEHPTDIIADLDQALLAV